MIAKGARKGGSRLAGSSEVMVLAQYTWEEGRHRRFIKHCVPRTSFPSLRVGYDSMMAGLAWCDTVRSFLPFGAPAEEIFELSVVVLGSLGDQDAIWPVLAWGLARMLAEEGVASEWTVALDTGEKLTRTPVAFDLRAGGPVEGEPSGQTRWIPIEVLRSLAAVSALESPPPQLRHAIDVVNLLREFIEYSSDCRLTALTALIREARAEQSGLQ